MSMVETDSDFKQLCVWQGTILQKKDHDDFVEFFKSELDVRVKVAECVYTNPDVDGDGNPVPDTGGRADVLFWCHDDDIQSFSVKRLGFDGGIRWWEDVVSYNDNAHLYTEDVLERYPVKW
jgi:hypothetical protein